MKTMLTTQEQNLQAVFHFKHETFSALQYAHTFGTIAKESIKRVGKWAAKYHTHTSSYYHVPQTGMLFPELNFLAPLPSETLPKMTKMECGLGKTATAQ